jgi:hypothetical protein
MISGGGACSGLQRRHDHDLRLSTTVTFTASVSDVFSRRIVGWRTAAAMPTDLPLDAPGDGAADGGTGPPSAVSNAATPIPVTTTGTGPD